VSKIKAKTAAIIIILLGVIGVVDAGILTYDHQKFSLGDAAGTVCEPGGGCAAVRSSPLSAVPLGKYRPVLPISLLGMACYLVVIGLGVMRLRNPDDPHAGRLLLGIGVLSTLYSAVLFGYSIASLGKVCPYCVVLYVIGLAVLVVSAMSLGESFGDWLKGVWGSLKSKAGAGAFVGFAALTFAGYNVYASPINDQLESAIGKLTAEARKLPTQPAVTLDVQGRPFEGAADGVVHIVKFADYECPHCGGLFKAVHEVAKKHPGKVKVTMMNFPLSNVCNPKMKRPFHKNACMLAYAGECAHKQGKWEKIAGWLYDNARGIKQEVVVEEARRLGLDIPKFEACMKAPETDAQIKTDIETGIAAGVRATPTFFVNGRKVEGGRPPEVLEAIVDAFLQAEAK